MIEIDTIKKKLRRPIPMRGFEVRLYAFVLLSLLFGLCLSLSIRDWQYFERSGSLVIVAAIYMAWRDHVQLLGRVEKFYKKEYERLLSQLDAKPRAGIISSAMHDEEREVISATSSNVKELISMLQQRLRTTEAVILCLGTLIWGYGSPVLNLLLYFEK
jgi:hypothetical protein